MEGLPLCVLENVLRGSALPRAPLALVCRNWRLLCKKFPATPAALYHVQRIGPARLARLAAPWPCPPRLWSSNGTRGGDLINGILSQDARAALAYEGAYAREVK